MPLLILLLILPVANVHAANPVEAVVGFGKDAMSLLVGSLAYIMLAIASFMLSIIGVLFNMVILKTVFEFGQYFGASDGLILAWGIMRDIGNIVLLFGFIFMGLATILNTHSMDEFSARKALPRLIIFAVLLNFSLFASQLVIDTANGFASVFAAQAGQSCVGAAASEDCVNVGIAGSVLRMAGIANIWSVVNLSTIGSLLMNAEAQAPVYIGLALFVTITAVVLLAGAIMLIARAVVLMFLMITSPIGFAGMAIPPLQGLAKRWWHTLINQSFFAPIFILLILLSLKVSEDIAGTTLSGTQTVGGEQLSLAAALIQGNSGGMGPQVFVVFGIVIGFMIASLMIAKKLGAYGANYATQTAGKVMGATTLGSVGFIGRRTLGRGSAALATSVRSSRFLTERAPGLGILATGVLDKGAHASYSVRGLASTSAKGAGIDFGKANKTAAGGYHSIEEKAEKERTDFAKSFKGRIETPGEVAARTTAAEASRKAAAEEITKQQAAVNAAQLEQQAVESEVDKKATIVRHLRRQADNAVRSSGIRDAAIEEKLAAAEKDLKKNEVALTAADTKVSEASKGLEKAREAEAAAAKEAADRSYRKISAKEQQIRYADTIEHKGLGIERTRRDGSTYKVGLSAGPHANHAAAAKIKTNANKGDLEKALDSIKSEYEKVSKKGDDHGGGGGGHAAPASGPAKSGGGDHH